MPYAKTVQSLIWVETNIPNPGDGDWQPGPDILITKNSFSRAEDPGDGTTQVWFSDGASARFAQTVQQMQDFLNAP